MPIGYFSRYPIITYNNVQCVDITRRLVIEDQLRTQTNAFYPYDVMEGLRPDHIADAYYKDPALDWLLFLSTEIIDPYYGWPLDENLFIRFIEDKYGSADYAQQKTKFWRIAWEGDYRKITPSYFNSLPDPLKKYFGPLFGASGQIVEYERKEQEYTTNTNKIMRFEITLNSSNGFANGEFVDLKYSGEIVGTGEIYNANSSEVLIYQVTGNTTANSTHNLLLLGEATSANATATSSNTIVQVISLDEIAYWSPVSYFTYEREINEQRKTIAVMRSDLVGDVIDDMALKLLEE